MSFASTGFEGSQLSWGADISDAVLVTGSDIGDSGRGLYRVSPERDGGGPDVVSGSDELGSGCEVDPERGGGGAAVGGGGGDGSPPDSSGGGSPPDSSGGGCPPDSSGGGCPPDSNGGAGFEIGGAGGGLRGVSGIGDVGEGNW